MVIAPITQIQGKAVPIPGADIDTDRIIPARFLKCVTFDDLAEGLFYDERFDAQDCSKGHPLDQPEHKGASIMIVGANFGCGSSREHAPQSIKRFGIDAIIGLSFAEIFFGNATNLGIPCVTLNELEHETLLELVAKQPEQIINLNLESMTVGSSDHTFPITMPEGAKSALTSGKWDSIAELLQNTAAIDAVATDLAYVQ